MISLQSPRPCPKPERKEKVKKAKPKYLLGIPKVSNKAKFTCSDGTKVSQTQIDYQLRKAYNKGRTGMTYKCECCNINDAWDHDHSIAQSRCKKIGKTDLVWDFHNWSHSCRDCHSEWESYKSGAFEDHANVVERMLYVKKHDPETFIKRKMCISNFKVLKAIS